MLADEVLELLNQEISKNEIENYISQIKFNEKSSNSENVIFTAPNELVAKFIQTRYASKIANIFEVKTGIKPVISITTQKNRVSIKAKDIDVKQIRTQSSLLNPSYTFESFVVGDSNQFAYISSQQAAQNPGKVYNPLFIYGSTGLGKTHLLQSIGNYCLEHGKTVICVTSEQFMSDFIRNVENRTMNKFKEKYRNCDVLLIDDIQFFHKSEKTQEEFFHTFNEIHSKKGQIVMTSDKPPKMLKGFEERLKSRFEWGLMADITPPELDTKIRIIKAKCEFDGINLSSDIIEYIAANMGDNIREIESAIININAFANIMRQEITLEFAKNVIKDQIKEKKDNISLENIISCVSHEMNIKPSDIKSKSRTKSIVEARRICIYLAKTLTPNSMPQLATHFGLKDHSAVSHNIKKINEIINNDGYFKARVEELKNKITSKE
ncbi:chromosomal replication initiator protein DnaA [Campylobacter fetus]|nr:chromosomal replication initiator protein DnaA [Campylobacter fetus]